MLQILQGTRSRRACSRIQSRQFMDAIREIRPQILMLNWRRAARWARSADHSERSTDSAADRRGSYLLSSVEESCRESDSQRSWVQIPPGPLPIRCQVPAISALQALRRRSHFALTQFVENLSSSITFPKGIVCNAIPMRNCKSPRYATIFDPEYHRFCLQETVNRFDTVDPSDPALFESAEGCLDQTRWVRVHVRVTCLEFIRCPCCLLDVSGPYRRTQTVFGIVRSFDGLLHVVDPENRQRRAEAFLPADF